MANEDEIVEIDLTDVDGLLGDLEEGLEMSLQAVRGLRRHFDFDEKPEQKSAELDVLGPIAKRIAERREENTIKD
jgi:hypothetical protein